MTIRNGRRNRVRRNSCERAASPGRNGILLIATDGGTSEDNTIEGNVCRNHATADFAIRGVNGGVVRSGAFRGNLGTRVIDGAVELGDLG
jgi:hypothetical protein